MKVLVIDDQRRNIASAQKLVVHGLAVVAVDNIVEARKLLIHQHGEFDAVLTDLHMPVGKYRGVMADWIASPKEELPVGLVFALTASNFGIRTVICTDSDHHRDWISALLSLVREASHCADYKVAYEEARNCRLDAHFDEERNLLVEGNQQQDAPLVKDWFMAMQRSRLFPELNGA